MHYAQRFVQGYIECALWSSMDSYDDYGLPLDENYTASDMSYDLREQIASDCASFIWYNRRDLKTSGLSPERAGHDFWLTRNRHGAGFWDEGLRTLGDRLTEAAHAYGTVDLYIGDDDRIHGT